MKRYIAVALWVVLLATTTSYGGIWFGLAGSGSMFATDAAEVVFEEGDAVLLENGDYLLAETGDKLLLE